MSATSVVKFRTVLGSLGVFRQLQFADLVAVDFVWSIDQPQRACVGVIAREPEVVADAGSTVRLDRPVDDFARHRVAMRRQREP